MKLYKATQLVTAYFVAADDASDAYIAVAADEALSDEIGNGAAPDSDYCLVWAGHRPEGSWNRGCLVYGAKDEELTLGAAIDKYTKAP